MLVVSRGLQNRCGGLGTSQVGSIPTYSRQPPPWFPAAGIFYGKVYLSVNAVCYFLVSEQESNQRSQPKGLYEKVYVMV